MDPIHIIARDGFYLQVSIRKVIIFFFFPGRAYVILIEAARSQDGGSASVLPSTFYILFTFYASRKEWSSGLSFVKSMACYPSWPLLGIEVCSNDGEIRRLSTEATLWRYDLVFCEWGFTFSIGSGLSSWIKASNSISFQLQGIGRARHSVAKLS